MNIFQKIKALWAVKGAVSNIQEAQVKDGWKTTEFWMTVCTNVITIVGALQGVIPPQVAAIIVAGVNGVYGILRTIVKTPSAPTPPAA